MFVIINYCYILNKIYYVKCFVLYVFVNKFKYIWIVNGKIKIDLKKYLYNILLYRLY